MSRHAWMIVLAPIFVAACATSGNSGQHVDSQNVDGKSQLVFSKQTYDSLLVEFKSDLTADGLRYGCGIVGFELDDEGHASDFKVFYSAPDDRFGSNVAKALAATILVPRSKAHRLAIGVTDPGPDAIRGFPAECNLEQFFQAGRQTRSEGYSGQELAKGDLK